MNRERWLELSPHLDRALEMAADERATWLAELRTRDARLAADLEELLSERSALERDGFLAGAGPPGPLAAAQAGDRLGAYRLLAPIGRGGMGTVWLGERTDGRFVGRAAIKLLNTELMGRAGEERFRREGDILARLTHPHIAHLIDAGVAASGQPYLVLEHVEGEPIDRYCDRLSLGIEERVRIFQDVLAAVAHAHAHLVVHRDIKPSNVLVSRDGQVKLLDFGIAKLLDRDAGAEAATALTRDGGRALTPEYAAPEQVTGGAITTATDVYTLGVLLYVLLGGRHPAGDARSTPADLLRAIVELEPQRLSTGAIDDRSETAAALADIAARRGATPDRLRRTLAGDLDTIVAKALKKRPEERYVSVAALSDDLRRYLEHRPISARPDTPAYRMARFVRRHRVPVAFAALAVVVLLAGLVGTLSQARRATRQAAIANQQRDFALRQLQRAESMNELNAFLIADAAPSGKPFHAGELLDRAARIVERQPGGSDEIRAELLIEIGRQFRYQDADAKARPLLEQALELASAANDPSTRGKAACALASSVSRAGDAEAAERLFQEGVAALGDDPRFALHRVFCWLRGSEVARDLDDPAHAVERVETAQRLLRESGQGSTLLELRVELDLAESYRTAGRLRDANAAFERAAARLEAAGRGDTETAGTLLNNWALVVRDMGNPLRAEPLFRRAVEIGSADGSHANVSPMLLNNLARTLIELARPAEARELSDRVAREARRTGDELMITYNLFLQPLIYFDLDQADPAARAIAELAPRVDEYPAGHYFYAVLASLRGLLAQEQGNLAGARAEQSRALEIAAETPQADIALPWVLQRRAAAALAAGDYAAARQDAERSIELRAKLIEPDALSAAQGQTYLLLGRALSAQGAAAAAQEAFAAALRNLEPNLGPDHPATRAAREATRPAG